MRGKVLVIGGTGLVGNALLRSWEARGAKVAGATYHCHPTGGFLQLDMQDAEGVRTMIARIRPAVVAVPAANPFVDYCEQHPEETRKINVAGTLNVARASREFGARTIFYSSDYVFDGIKGEYIEEDVPSPINEYGRQKAEAETGILATDSRNLVIRTSGAYGWQWEPKNFVLQILGRLSAGKAMHIANDIRYNPTYVENLAQITAELVDADAAGVFHVVGADKIVRYDFAMRVARAFGLDTNLLIAAPQSALVSTTPRPKQSSLLTDRVRATVSSRPLGVEEGLTQMVKMKPRWVEYARSLPDPAAKALPPTRLDCAPKI